MMRPLPGWFLLAPDVACVANGEGGLDERGVGQRLWEVAEVGSRRGVHLFGVEAERAGVLEQRLEQLDGLGVSSGAGEGLDEPERAG